MIFDVGLGVLVVMDKVVVVFFLVFDELGK